MSQSPDIEATAMVRKRYINPLPTEDVPEGVGIAAQKREFGKRLQHLITEKGWSQSELARAAAKFMPDKKFNRDNVSLYVRGQQLPGPIRLKAMCKALKVEAEDLIPPGATASVDDDAPPLSLRPIGNGIDWLQINQALPHDIAMEIMVILGKINAKK